MSELEVTDLHCKYLRHTKHTKKVRKLLLLVVVFYTI